MKAITKLSRTRLVLTMYVYGISNPTMEETSSTHPKYQPLQVLWHQFVYPCLKNYSLGTHSLVYSTKSTFVVSRIIGPKFVKNFFTSFSYIICLMKCFLSSKTFLHMCRFFLSLFLCFIFITHFFGGLVGACVNPVSFSSNSLFVHSLVCPITHSFLDEFQPNLYQHLSRVHMLYLSYFSA